jgi:hypothetical protein
VLLRHCVICSSQQPCEKQIISSLEKETKDLEATKLAQSQSLGLYSTSMCSLSPSGKMVERVECMRTLPHFLQSGSRLSQAEASGLVMAVRPPASELKRVQLKKHCFL